MEIVFLGTASNNPSPTRGVSSTCLRLEGEVWMFDAGESTQIQLMRSPIKPGKLTKIFITHLHGDHVFGLPGLMCTIGQNVTEDRQMVEIYGPVGLRRFVRNTLELSRSMVTYKYVVHEIVPVKEQFSEDVENWKIIESDDTALHPSETLGNQIYVNPKGYWNLLESETMSVSAGWIKHRIPSFGFVVEQKPLPGKLDVEGLRQIGVKPGPIYSKIKSGENVKLDDGTTVEASKFVGPSRPGKKITLLGDCCECSPGMAYISTNCDVLVHEATLEDAFQAKAISYGHSTPSMASQFANLVKAKCLILNHFSQRYKPLNYVKEAKNCDEDGEGDDDSVQKLIDEAKASFGTVLAAYDFFAHRV